jgi:release factor glutamine methyltransferase
VELHAADIDPVAVKCGSVNVTEAGGQIYQGDLYSALPGRLRGRVRLLAVNAPYVPTAALRTMPPEARDYEPRVSLDGGVDGLDLHRRVAKEAAEWLAPGGHVLIETSQLQAAGTAALMNDVGFAARTVRSEELDGTVVIGSHFAAEGC